MSFMVSFMVKGIGEYGVFAAFCRQKAYCFAEWDNLRKSLAMIPQQCYTDFMKRIT